MRKNYRGLLCGVLLAAAIGQFSGCGFGFGMRSSYIYDHAEKYAVGDAEISDEIDTIDIDYISGDVKLVKADTDVITIEETAGKKLNDKLKVHTWVDGKTLHIKFCESGKGLNLNNLDKKLVVTVPDDVDYDKIIFDMSSGDVDVDCSAKKFDFDASSGNINLTQTGNSDEILADTSSGSISVDAESIEKFVANASSGDITVNAESIKTIHTDTSSGDNEFRLETVPETADIEASSGQVKLYLPENADITAEIDTASGNVSYDLPFEKKEDTYKCGKGTSKFRVDTSSGNVTLNKLN
ncbi:MAG: DUF4097 family beta strand repeat protein [Eubacterium sp.]|nr:DUF4097 family beta strand repeat protein [Eubacterium sp.]